MKYFLIMACFGLLGCQDHHSSKQLKLREQQISQREKDFSLKLADDQRLLEMERSLPAKQDSVIQWWPRGIEGIWRGKSICKESNCPKYVIGDKRSYIWEFIGDSTGLYTIVSNNNHKLIRVYNARLDSSGIQLFYESDVLATRSIELNVALNQADQHLMTGTQSTSFDNACKADLLLSLRRKSIAY